MNTMNIEFNPTLFNLSDSKKSFLSDANKIILKKISSSIKHKKQLLLVIGEKGSGKTMLVQRAIEDLKTKLVFINISGEELSFEALIDHTGNHIKEGFPVESSLDIKSAHLKVLIKTKSIKHIVFLINPSATKQPITLESAVKLINSNLFDRCSSHLIITGKPDLEAQLKESNLLINDVNSFHVNPLSETDIRAYISFHLKHLEQGDTLFSKAAIQQIIHYSKGRPQLINRLCEQGLMMADIEEASTVTEGMINEVLENSVFLNNEFDYEAPELEKVPPKPFINSFNQAAVSAQPTKKSPALPDDFFSKLESNPPARPKKNKKQLKQKPPSSYIPTPVQQSTQVIQKNDKIPTNDTASHIGEHHNSPPKEESSQPKAVSIFAMGMVTSAIIGSTWYYFDQQQPNLLKGTVATSGFTELTLPEEKVVMPLSITKKSRPLVNNKKVLKPTPEEKEIYQKVASIKKIEAPLLPTKETPTQLIKPVVDKADITPAIPAPSSEPIDVMAIEKIPATKQIEPVVALTQKKSEPIKKVEVKEKPIIPQPSESAPNKEEQLLAQAKQQFISKQLMSPINNNAWSTYEKVLKLNPKSKQALDGLSKIKDVYMGWAKQKINNGNDIHALHYLNKASKISPNDPEILAAFDKIKKTAIAKSRSFNPKLETRLYRLLDKPEGIQELLSFAKQQITEKNLTKPISNSAFSIYKLILNRFPNHPQALQGIQKVKGRYLSWARYEIKQGNLSHAEYLYTKALEVSPSDPEIMSDLDQLKQTTKPL